jgi:hypothetical protein
LDQGGGDVNANRHGPAADSGILCHHSPQVSFFGMSGVALLDLALLLAQLFLHCCCGLLLLLQHE